MGALSIRDFNSNISKALARVASGETIEIMRNGKVFAEIRPKTAARLADPAWRRNFAELMDLLDQDLPLRGPFSYDERTG